MAPWYTAGNLNALMNPDRLDLLHSQSVFVIDMGLGFT